MIKRCPNKFKDLVPISNPQKNKCKNQKKKLIQEKAQQEKTQQEKEPSVESDDLVEATQDIRLAWKKGNKVQIFSNTHKEWFDGEVLEIVQDEEGEWLNIMWQRENNEPMSKQVQRFSTDVRPFQEKTEKEKEEAECVDQQAKTKSLEEEIKQRRQGYKRRAPPFARTSPGVLWKYPATQAFRRRTKKLDNVEETEEEEERTECGIEKWTVEQVCEWIKTNGSAYAKYVPKFRTIRGSKIKHMNEDDFKWMGLPNLHAVKLSFEILKLLDKSIGKDMSVDVLRWSSGEVGKWAQKHPLLKQYSSKFESHGIDGVLLFELNAEDLITIGIPSSHREKVLESIQEFGKQSFPEVNPSQDKDKEKVKEKEKEKEKDKDKDKNKSNNGIETMKNGNGVCNPSDKKGTDIVACRTEQSNEEQNHSIKKKKQLPMQLHGVPVEIRVLKDFADLLSLITKELNNQKIQSQALLLQKKVDSLVTEVTIHGPEENSHVNESDGLEKKSSTSSTQNSHLADKASSVGEDGKPLVGVTLPYINSVEQQKGHRRRQSKPFLNQMTQEENKRDAGNVQH